jgi:hypothetical protein
MQAHEEWPKRGRLQAKRLGIWLPEGARPDLSTPSAAVLGVPTRAPLDFFQFLIIFCSTKDKTKR